MSAAAESFPSGARPLVAALTVDGLPAFAVLDLAGVCIFWEVDRVQYSASMAGAELTRIVATMPTAWTIGKLRDGGFDVLPKRAPAPVHWCTICQDSRDEDVELRTYEGEYICVRCAPHYDPAVENVVCESCGAPCALHLARTPNPEEPWFECPCCHIDQSELHAVLSHPVQS